LNRFLAKPYRDIPTVPQGLIIGLPIGHLIPGLLVEMAV
jgi:hypothetical protein